MNTRTTRLARHLAAAAAAACAVGSHAEVITYTLNAPVGATIDGLYINVETGATYDGASADTAFAGWDLNPYGSSTMSFFWSGTANGSSAGVRLNTVAGGTTSGTTCSSLPAGFVVGASLVGGASGASFGTGSASFTTTAQGKWTFNALNYFGFRFTTAAGATRYGYGVMQVGATATVRTLVSVSFENTGGSITIPGTVPPYDPCSASNPQLTIAGGALAMNQTTAANLTVGGMTISKANYFKFTPTATGSYSFSTCATGAATRMAILDNCTAGAAVIASNDNACGSSAEVSASLTSGTPVYVVIGGEGSDIPNPINVVVVAPPLPSCVTASAAAYGANPITSTANPGVSQLVQSNAANTATATIYNAQWYAFTPSATGAFVFKTCNSGDTKLAIGTACPAVGGTFNTIAYNDDAPTCPTTSGGTNMWGSWIDATNNGSTSGFPLTQNLNAGQTYYVCVGGYGSTSVVNGALTIEGPDNSTYDPCRPSNPTLVAGGNSVAVNQATAADLNVGSMVITKANYYKFTPSVSGTWSFSTCATGAATRMAILDNCTSGAAVLASNDNACGSSAEVSASLTGGAPVYVVVGGEGTDIPNPIGVVVQGPPIPACVNAGTAAYGDNVFDTSVGNNGAQTVQASADGVTTWTINQSLWYAFTPTATGAFVFSTCGASGDTLLAIGTACPAVNSRFSTIAANDDAPCASGVTLRSVIDATNGGATGTFAGFPLTQNLVAGTTYYVCVGAYSTTTAVTGTLNISGPEGNPCPGDLDGDGSVGGADLGLLLGAWGACPGTPCLGDLNLDGEVNGADLGLLLGQWGPCP